MALPPAWGAHPEARCPPSMAAARSADSCGQLWSPAYRAAGDLESEAASANLVESIASASATALGEAVASAKKTATGCTAAVKVKACAGCVANHQQCAGGSIIGIKGCCDQTFQCVKKDAAASYCKACGSVLLPVQLPLSDARS